MLLFSNILLRRVNDNKLRLLTCHPIVSSSIIFAQDAKKTETAAEQPFAWVSPGSSSALAKKALPATVKHATFKSAAMSVDIGYYIYLPPEYETSQEKYPELFRSVAPGGSGFGPKKHIQQNNG